MICNLRDAFAVLHANRLLPEKDSLVSLETRFDAVIYARSCGKLLANPTKNGFKLFHMKGDSFAREYTSFEYPFPKTDLISYMNKIIKSRVKSLSPDAY